MTDNSRKTLRENLRVLIFAYEHAEKSPDMTEEEFQSHLDTVREEIAKLEHEDKKMDRVARANSQNRKRFREI